MIINLKLKWIILFISILLTILSQHPLLLSNNIGRYLLFIWVLPLLNIVFYKRIKLYKNLLAPLIIYLIWFVFLITMEAFTGEKYFNIPNLRNLSLMLVMMLIGFYIASEMSEVVFQKILYFSTLIGGLIFCIGIFNYSFNVEDLDIYINSRGYLYAPKNSASQIIFSCFIYVLMIPIKSKYSFIRYPVLIFMLYIILLLKSRTVILQIAIVFFFLMFKSGDKKLILYSIIVLLFGIILIAYSDNLSSIFIEGILFGGRDITDLNDVSSGRFSMFYSFPRLFNENIFFGRGYYFIESFPLATLLQVGILGSLIIFSFLYWTFRTIREKFIYTNNFDLSLIILFYSFLFNSLFEEQAPFGPGAKSFLFWLPFGFVLFKRAQRSIN